MMTALRKLAAILADVVGYSCPMMGDEPARLGWRRAELQRENLL